MLVTPKVRRFLRFCIVGVGNTAADLGLFWLLSWAGAPFLVAQVLSYSAGVLNSYLLNRHWTFRISSRANPREAAKFLVVNLLSLGASTAVLYGLHDLFHVGLGFAKVLAMAAAPIVNFIGNLLWVFSESLTRGEINEG